MRNLKLNIKHLRYFWTVATLGSVTRAAESLFLTPQTISGQLRELEEHIGEKLFEREGRRLVPTETGRLVFSYADEMFRLGVELEDLLSGTHSETTLTVNVGVAMVVPKLIAYRVLEPVLQLDQPIRMICHEASLVDLLADLSVHKLDVVLADSPINPAMNVKAYNHLLGESGISFFAAPNIAHNFSKQFPHSLQGANILMPSVGSTLRRDLDAWFDSKQIIPQIIAEFDDRALMKAFGEMGIAVFTSPTTVEQDVIEKYKVQVIGRTEEIKENYYAISAERKIKHPAVAVITQRAREELFT